MNPYFEGIDAFQTGKRCDTNPYHERRDYHQWVAWHRGWNDADYQQTLRSKKNRSET